MNANLERVERPPRSLSKSEINDLLDRTSRTFAICIPMLPGSLRWHVALSYLLFRIGDTLEDTVEVDRDEKIRLLVLYRDILMHARTDEARADREPEWVRRATEMQQVRPTSNVNELSLHRQTASIVASAIQTPIRVRNTILSNAEKSIEGMIGFVSSPGSSRGIQLRSTGELSRYCYCVAGIVGELLTDLFLAYQPALAKAGDELRSRAVEFGEALQLVNILKDADVDEREHRRFIPEDVSRDQLFELAYARLQSANEYIEILRKNNAERGLIRFTKLPVSLASLTLELVRENGAGAKVSREEVARIVAGLDSEATAPISSSAPDRSAAGSGVRLTGNRS